MEWIIDAALALGVAYVAWRQSRPVAQVVEKVETQAEQVIQRIEQAKAGREKLRAFNEARRARRSA